MIRLLGSRGLILSFALLGMVGFANGCKQSSQQSRELPAVNEELIVVVRDLQQLKRGTVGVGKFQAQAAYVLVDVKNKSSEALSITLGGTLNAEGGNAVGTLTPQSLVVPAKGVRMFALVDNQSKPRPSARDATVQLIGAARLEFPEEVRVSRGSVRIDDGRAVVLGEVENLGNRPAQAVVIAGFYDGEGKPMKRPSTLFELAVAGKRGVQFVGPTGSKSAYLYIGQVTFP